MLLLVSSSRAILIFLVAPAAFAGLPAGAGTVGTDVMPAGRNA
jgi:hypothetical protein